MAASLPTPTFGSSILKLPTGRRSAALRKISANANAPGGAKKQTNGRARKDAMSRLASALGIYPIETNVTGALAANVGGASPASIVTNAGTPDPTPIAASELDPVTWVGAGTKSLSVTVGSNPATLLGEAQVTV